jgi:Tol biopolymer transport system component
MAVVGTHDDAPPRSMGWLDWALASDITPDGKTVVFGESGEGAGADYGVYIRKTDGSPAVRLGDGAGGAISPDGKWVATADLAGPENGINILPVGAGEPRHLPDAAVSGLNINWTPDSKSLLYIHLESDGHRRVYRESVDGTGRKPITPADESFAPARSGVSPDGKFLIAHRLSDQAEVLIALDGSGAMQVVPGIKADEVARHWSSDGKSIYLQSRGNLQTGSQILKFDLATGKREMIKTILPADLAGYAGNDGQLVSADGSTIVFSYTRILSTLYTLEQPK